MTTVFLGGSRSISRLNSAIRERVDSIVSKRCRIVVGDANGVDRALQAYLASLAYSEVEVFCMKTPRNNAGNWPIRVVEAPVGARGFDYYAAKDRAMSSEANCGLMLWDGQSRGARNNLEMLSRDSKVALVYLGPLREFRRLAGAEDLERLFAELGVGTIEPAAALPRLRFTASAP